jgi:hypothetical protein
MKFHTKALFGAIALALAGQASAAITQGDLLLEVWDTTDNVSYTRDLGITMAQFDSEIGLNTSTGTTTLASALTFADSDGLFASTFSNDPGANLTWNIVASNLVGSTQASAIVSATSLGETAPNTSKPGIGGIYQRAQGLVTDVAANATTVSGNSAYYNAAADAGGYGAGGNWGDTMGGNYQQGTSATGYSSLYAFYAQGKNSGLGTAVPIFNYLTQGGGDDTFSLASNGTVTFSAVSPTPLPAAAWLLGSGLLGLFGIGRRRAGQSGMAA